MNNNNKSDTERLLERIRDARRRVSDEARQDAIKQQHENGKLTARERIEYLVDDGSFQEVGRLASPEPTTPETQDWTREDAPADGLITGTAEIQNRPAAIVGSDFTVLGGSIGHMGFRKFERVAELALENGYPLILLHDGGGHRIQEGLDARTYARTDGQLFTLMQRMSGWVPIVSAMMGPGFAAPTNFAALSDFVPMVDGTSTLGVAGPSLVKAALGVDITQNELGGAQFHTQETGMADIKCRDDSTCLDAIQRFLSYLPSNASSSVPMLEDTDPPPQERAQSLLDYLPLDTKRGYDISVIIEGIIDRDSLFELKPKFAQNIVTGFVRFDGKPVGIVANNPKFKAGTIDAAASTKAARFISLCDAFGLPILWLIDCPGVLPGHDSEQQGIARRSGKLLYEITRATVPTLSIILRRGYGFGYVVMGGGRIGNAELSVAWPTAEVAAMSIEGAVDIAYKDQIAEAENPETERKDLIHKFRERTGPLRAAAGMGIDAVIDPSDTREHIITTLERSEETSHQQDPPKKHGINPW